MKEQSLLNRLDEIQMSESDRAAAKAQLVQAERLADLILAGTSSLKKWIGTLVVTPIRRGVALIRSSFKNFGLIS